MFDFKTFRGNIFADFTFMQVIISGSVNFVALIWGCCVIFLLFWGVSVLSKVKHEIGIIMYLVFGALKC